MQERVGSGVADRLALPVSRYDIADYLALSVETVSRSLTGLKDRGVIALHGPREIRIVDRDALADEYEIREVLTWPAEVKRRAPSAIRDVPQTRSVEVRVPPFAFGGVLGEMRRWLDHERCEPSRFTCVREGSGAVIIRVEFAKESGALVEAFKQEFASPAALASG
jgi:hypothetical protein